MQNGAKRQNLQDKERDLWRYGIQETDHVLHICHMNHTIPFLLLLLFVGTANAQQRPMAPYMDAHTPAWVRLMADPNPNVHRVQEAFAQWHAERPISKNTYTQYYKRWMQWARAHTQADGSVHCPTAIELTQDEDLRRALRNHDQAQKGSSWRFNGPVVHYFPDASAQSVDHTNIYTFDIFEANTNILYAGGEAGGVWKTTDKGLNWTLLTAEVVHGAFGAVKINPSDPDMVYACTDGKIIKTTNGGQTWTTVYTENNLWVDGLYIHATNPQVVLAASEQGLLRSNNGGASWNKVFTQRTWAIQHKPGDPNTVWAVRKQGNGVDFMVSTNGGTTFSASNTGLWQPTAGQQVTGALIAPCPSRPEKVYVFLSGEGPGLGGHIGVFQSINNGATWSNTNPNNAIGQPYNIPNHTNLMDANGVNWFYQGFYDQAIAVNPLNDNQLIAGGCSWFRSDNGGATWYPYGGYVSSPGITGDRHPDIQWAAAVGQELWIASDGGLVYSTNFGQDVEGRNRGISGAALWGFGSGWNEDILVGGRYHNGNMAYHESFPDGTYYAIGGAESATGYVNPGPERKVYHSDIGGRIIHPGFGNGITGFPVGAWPNESYAYYANSEMEWHPDCWNMVFMGKDNKLWFSTDGGATFKARYAFPGNADNTVFDIEICRTHPERMYVSQWDGTDDAIYRSDDGGFSWTKCTPLPLPNNNDRIKLAVSAVDPNALWVAITYGSNGRKVYSTTDGGQTWTNRTTPVLNGLTITNMAAQHGTDGGIYLGTAQGTVLYRNNQMGDWQVYSQGLPLSLETNRLKPFYKRGLIRNGCWNGGVWEAPFFESSAVQPLAMADKLSSYCPTDTFLFDDHSVVLHADVSWSWTFEDAQWVEGANTRTPRVVFGTPGAHRAAMALTTPQGTFTDTLVVYPGDACLTYGPEPRAGAALSLNGSSDFASASTNLNLDTRQATITAWIKPAPDQSPWAGIALVRGGTTTAGLHFGQSGELRYMWNDVNWWWNSGLTPQPNTWNHVALVIEPSKVTIYLNGIPASTPINHDVQAFDAPLVLGRDPGWDDRYFKGLIDEVCVYNRALTMEQIRTSMHLTRTHTDTSGLVSYVQFNEPDGPAFDRTGRGFYNLAGDAVRLASTAPVGPGSSRQLLVNGPGTFSFSGTGLTAAFNPGGIVPQGPVVSTRLLTEPDAVPGADSTSAAYWVIHYFGANAQFEGPDQITLDSVGFIPPAANPGAYRLYSRGPGADGPSWMYITEAAAAQAGDNGMIRFEGNDLPGAPAQLIVSKPVLSAAHTGSQNRSWVRVSPNPVSSSGKVYIQLSAEEAAVFRLFDARGRNVRTLRFTGSADMNLEGLPSGPYWYAIDGEKTLQTGKLVVY